MDVLDPDVTVLPPRLENPGSYRPLIREAVTDRERVWLIASSIHADLHVIGLMLSDERFVVTDVDERPGARLELWARTPTP
ncbi:MAG: hypothetical protein ACRD29_21010 [Acidimicrobiales bacterium]